MKQANYQCHQKSRNPTPFRQSRMNLERSDKEEKESQQQQGPPRHSSG